MGLYLLVWSYEKNIKSERIFSILYRSRRLGNPTLDCYAISKSESTGATPSHRPTTPPSPMGGMPASLAPVLPTPMPGVSSRCPPFPLCPWKRYPGHCAIGPGGQRERGKTHAPDSRGVPCATSCCILPCPVPRFVSPHFRVLRFPCFHIPRLRVPHLRFPHLCVPRFRFLRFRSPHRSLPRRCLSH